MTLFFIGMFFTMILLTVFFAHLSAKRGNPQSVILMGLCASIAVLIVLGILIYDTDLTGLSLSNQNPR